MVPTMLQRLLDQPDIGKLDFSNLRQIVYGGSHIASDLLGRAIRLFGPRLAQHYGQTEAPSTLTVLSRYEHTLENLAAGVLTSAGHAWTSVEARIANENDEEVPFGDIGELQIRAPHVMAGYWKQPELSNKILRGGWLHTNDLARIDERGFIYLLGRQDEMIISGGFNIAPREIEDALCDHPSVAEAAVFGKPDPEWGHIVFAFVTPSEPGLTRESLVEFTRTTLGYKRPKEIVFLPELPKNANGKVDKALLKKLMTTSQGD
jgi:acyl-CoA synthetase (AMP-forming)/AMP-acid ligase II